MSKKISKPVKSDVKKIMEVCKFTKHCDECPAVNSNGLYCIFRFRGLPPAYWPEEIIHEMIKKYNKISKKGEI
jgi:hypothetical protein